MGVVVKIKKKSILKQIYHKLFKCPTFWSLKPKFTCPLCGKKYRCYWDGNDTSKGINVCNKCTNEIEKGE